MILIADGGSTKTSWCLIKNDGQLSFFETEGYNPYFVNSDYISSSLHKNLPVEIACQDVLKVDFFGAGCFEDKHAIMRTGLQRIFSNASIAVDLDLAGAAKSLLGDGSGFAAILGTGSNTCLYRDGKIVQNIDSLGYFLGDEGSGCDIGKKLLSDYARGYLPIQIQEQFFETYRLKPAEILSSVHDQPLLNKYCAGFCTFVHAHIENDHVRSIVENAFYGFFKNLVSRYANYADYSFNCVGSVAYIFRELLGETATRFGMKTGRIIKSPMEGIVEYYLSKS